MTFGVTGNWSHALVTSSCCHEIFVAVVSNFNTVFTFFDKKSSHRSRNSHAYLFFFYLPTRLWNSFFAFEVLNRRGTSDSKCREWSVEAKRRKKNEYFEYLSKATAKKKICSKYFQTKKKTYFDHPRDLESGQGTPSPSPPPLCRVKILSSPGPMPHSQGSILSCSSKENAE